MSTTEVENKAQFRRIYEEMFNKGNLEIADELIAPDFLNHETPPGMQYRGPESHAEVDHNAANCLSRRALHD